MDHPVTLDECAQGVQQLNSDLQRTTDAYRYFTNTLTNLRKAAAGEKLAVTARLPFVPFTFATVADKGAPGVFRFDLNEVPADELSAMIPMFESLIGTCAEGLLTAWERLFVLTETARPLVNNARATGE